MPAYEAMFPRLIMALHDPDKVQQLKDALAANKTLPEIVSELGLSESEDQTAFIARTPTAIQVAILAVVKENLDRDEPKQMMFTWEGSYDWELNLRESTSSTISDGGITMRIGSRYPDDTHPGQPRE